MNKNKQKYIISNVNDFKEIVKGFWLSSFTEFINKIQWDTFIFKDSLLYIDKKNNEHCSLFKEIYLSSILWDNNVKKIIDWSNILYSIINIANLTVLRNTEFKWNENIYLIKNTEFSNCKFKNLKISILKDCKKIIIRWWKWKRIFILNTVIEWNIFLDNIEIWELILENINNNFESFEIRNCKIDKLVIKNSNLWKAVFNWVEIWELEIENATLNDCIFNWVDFKIYELTEIKKENSVNYKIMKDNYRQLKHVMDKNANYTEANEFYALEMDYLRKLYSETNKFPIKDIKNDNYYSKEIWSYWTKLILISLKIINNYWTNWLINIFFLVMLSTVFSVWKFFYNDYERSWMTISQTFTELWMLHQENLDLFWVIWNWVTFLSYFLLLFIFWWIIFAWYKNMILGIILYIGFLWFFINQEIFTNFINLLLNPAYWLKMIPEINDNIWLLFLLIYKIIYWILIYQLIIALKRTTRR